MKTQSIKHQRQGFTLIELLVVITIIAVLAAAGFSAGTAAMTKAKRVTAQAAATSLATAVDQFYTEYSALPNVGSSVVTNSAKGIELLNILAGLETTTPIQNDRKVRFLSLKEAKNGKDGLKYNTAGTTIEGLLDPWKEPFYVELDDDYDERLSFTPKDNSPVTLNGRRVAVYCLGVPNGDKSSNSKLVRTW